MERQSTAFILRLYFAVVSAVTLFTLMFAAVDLLQTGLKTYVITAADQPEWLEDCENVAAIDRPATPKEAPSADFEEPTEEELKAQCESRNASSVENYQRTKASNAVRNLALLIVAGPLFVIHFRTLYRDWMATHKE